MKEQIDNFSAFASPEDRLERQQESLYRDAFSLPAGVSRFSERKTDGTSARDRNSAGSLHSGLPELRLTDDSRFATPSAAPAENLRQSESNKPVSTSRSDSGWVVPLFGNSSDKKKNVPLEQTEKPDPALPDVWPHPPATKLDGKCGITGVSNLLRLYGIEKPPADIDQSHYRSWGPGMRVNKFAEDMRELSGKNFTSRNIKDGSDPLSVLQNNIKDGKPVAIMYMTSPTDAHWVVVTGITQGAKGPELQVQSWGAYHKVAWSDVQDQWRRGYGGPYPYVVGDEASPFLKKK